MQRNTVVLGTEVRDRITGFSGIVVAITNWLNGCERITVQPRELKDGCIVKNESFDVEDVEYVSEGVNQKEECTGGPCDDAAALRR